MRKSVLRSAAEQATVAASHLFCGGWRSKVRRRGNPRQVPQSRLLSGGAGSLRGTHEADCGKRCLTPRSSRAPTACHAGPAGGTRYIFAIRARASHRWCRLNSNVRLHEKLSLGCMKNSPHSSSKMVAVPKNKHRLVPATVALPRLSVVSIACASRRRPEGRVVSQIGQPLAARFSQLPAIVASAMTPDSYFCR